MPNPNVHYRVREVGWVLGVLKGNGGAVGHANLGNLAAGATTNINDFRPFLVNHALLGGFQSNFNPGVPETHCVYLEVQAHLRSSTNFDLPGRIRIFYSEVATPTGTQATVGDWVAGQMQEWEEWSPLTVPTPPPNFSSGGAAGTRYEYRRYLGRVPGNIVRCTLTNHGAVPATEWALGYFFRSNPPVYSR